MLTMGAIMIVLAVIFVPVFTIGQRIWGLWVALFLMASGILLITVGHRSTQQISAETVVSDTVEIVAQEDLYSLSQGDLLRIEESSGSRYFVAVVGTTVAYMDGIRISRGLSRAAELMRYQQIQHKVVNVVHKDDPAYSIAIKEWVTQYQ